MSAKTYGEKREHGLNSCDLDHKGLIPFRLQYIQAVYCVQSRRPTRIAFNIMLGRGVLHAAIGGSNAGDDLA